MKALVREEHVEFARASLDAFSVMHRAYMRIGHAPDGLRAMNIIAHAQARVLRTGIEPLRRARKERSA